MHDIHIVSDNISVDELKKAAEQRFGDMIKVVVDIKKEIMAIGGELHADEEAALLESGSQQNNLWGINIYVNEPKDKWVEFNSMINIRPSQRNNSRSVEDGAIRKRIIMIIEKLVK